MYSTKHLTCVSHIINTCTVYVYTLKIILDNQLRISTSDSPIDISFRISFLYYPGFNF